MKSCVICEKEFNSRVNNKITCSGQCSRKHELAQARLRSRRNAAAIARSLILKRDSWTCAYCGKPATQVDHIIPVCKNGKSIPENLIASCALCNQKKARKSININIYPDAIIEWKEEYTIALNNVSKRNSYVNFYCNKYSESISISNHNKSITQLLLFD